MRKSPAQSNRRTSHVALPHHGPQSYCQQHKSLSFPLRKFISFDSYDKPKTVSNSIHKKNETIFYSKNVQCAITREINHVQCLWRTQQVQCSYHISKFQYSLEGTEAELIHQHLLLCIKYCKSTVYGNGIDSG